MFVQMGESARPPEACVCCVCVCGRGGERERERDRDRENIVHPGLTFEHGADPPDPQAALACELTKGELHEEKRDPTEYQHDEVGEHEGTWQ
jgi:hypothetical protein